MDVDDVYDEEDEQRRLAEILDERYEAVLKAVHELTASAFPELENFRLDDPATRRMLREAAEQVVRIDDTTKAALREVLARGQELGLSNWEIANGSKKTGFPGIEGLFKETWAGRADTIARTEIAHAQNVASLDRYQATGLVDRVKIVENEDADEPCAKRNGKVVPLSARPGLLHPNCRLGLVPVLREGIA